jgi:hypothetical protein
LLSRDPAYAEKAARVSEVADISEIIDAEAPHSPLLNGAR